MVVLVTGAGGQLGEALQFVAPDYPQMRFVFCNSSELDIANQQNCETIFDQFQPDFCINAAAYTAVDKAESESEKAFLINVTGAKNIAESCKKHRTILLHVSTDFVFDGEKDTPYSEKDATHPTGVYGQTKLDGEKAIQAVFDDYFIIRTSWVYSRFGHNFMKTMIRLGNEKESLSVVNDQIGTPTNAVDLAEALLAIIASGKRDFGIYNFSNEGQCSWYDFAKKIFEINKIEIDLQPIPTTAYPTPAKRPKYSVLDKQKIKSVFGIAIQNWSESLKINTK
ncbi:dTDP-4-dehydrorhamnose reductase [Flavobacterium sp. 3HN19-14]|uniref:dTDP-4-dehydrorhamnose reductase n=1 Tax=Flavobacterium sp. 3HN19-14 TaxID=3448133 RepID=UPI003EE18658